MPQVYSAQWGKARRVIYNRQMVGETERVEDKKGTDSALHYESAENDSIQTQS